jgi:phosphate transport system permease protein
MSSLAPPPMPSQAPAPGKGAFSRRRRRSTEAMSLLAHGEPMVWLCGGGLAVCTLMIIAMLLLVLYSGIGTFWPVPVIHATLHDGAVRVGEVTRTETFTLNYGNVLNQPPAIRDKGLAILDPILAAQIEQVQTGGASAAANIRSQVLPPGLSMISNRLRRDMSGESLDAVLEVLARPTGALDDLIVDQLRELEPPLAESFRQKQPEFSAPLHEWWALPHDARVEALSDPQTVAQIKFAVMTEWWVTTITHTDRRNLVRTGNYELTNEHFYWVSDFAVATQQEPQWSVLMERQSWGRFYGEPVAFLVDGEVVAEDAAGSWAQFEKYHGEVRERWAKRRRLEKRDTGHISHMKERSRLAHRNVEMAVDRAEMRHGRDSEAFRRASAKLEQATADFEKVQEQANSEFLRIREQITELNRENARYQLRMVTSDGTQKDIPIVEVVRAYLPNQIGLGEKVGIYLSRWREFLLDDPREANMEGGVFPAIFGTMVMTLLMSFAVVPFGVLAALYLREYAKGGPIVSAVRIAINNLAGVPSIVFGVFGLGFFCYVMGWSIDQLFFASKLPAPTFGTGGILWASLTLALLTLPVVIVATEEALSAVPSSMREGSYACGASKWQTIKRIVLPRAMPGIMTGTILAMARGAGEVAPLMIVGAVKLAPELPVDGYFPFFHLERSFMHLGFHIYDLGFQSQNSEAAKPMVYTTTLLLILIIAALNFSAIWLRSRLRRRFVTSAF